MFKKETTIQAIIFIFSLLLAGCSSSNTNGNIDCSIPENFCVGLVTEVGKTDDKSLNQSAWEGVKQAKKELGAYVQYIETTNTRDFAKNIAAFADDKYDVIITVGSDLGEATVEAARAYPDVMFIGVDQPQAAAISNLTGLVFQEDQAGYAPSHELGRVVAAEVRDRLVKIEEGLKDVSLKTEVPAAKP